MGVMCAEGGSMPVITVSVSAETYQFLRRKRKKEGKTRGMGTVIDVFVAAESAREQVRDTLEQAQLVSREQWDQTGLCVD